MNVQLVAAEKLNQCNQVSRCEMKLFVSRFPRRQENLEKIKMVMEKALNMKNWPKVMEFCAQSWSFTNFASKLCQICIFWTARNQAAI